jgi:hypothetical protein
MPSRLPASGVNAPFERPRGGWRAAKLERPAIPAGVVREEPVADLAYALLILGGFALLALTLKGLERL